MTGLKRELQGGSSRKSSRTQSFALMGILYKGGAFPSNTSDFLCIHDQAEVVWGKTNLSHQKFKKTYSFKRMHLKEEELCHVGAW